MKRWTKREDARLRAAYVQGMPWSDDLLTALPGRTRDAIQRRASELGLTRAQSRDEWTEAENATIRAHYPARGKATAKRLPGRTEAAVKLQAGRLGVPYTGDGAKTGKDWSDDEDQIIKRYYPREGVDCKSRMLRRRTDAAIRARAVEMHVRRIK